MGLFSHAKGSWSGPDRRRDQKTAARWDGVERRRDRPSLLEGLESRVLLHGHVDASSLVDWNDLVNTNADAISLTLLDQAQAGSDKMPLSSVPQLSSDPGAPATIYLDFVGAPAMTWLQYSVPATPAYDQDGDPTTFSSAELTSITQIWQEVAEEYSPFNVNVTTVPLASLAHGQNMELIVGGSSETWLGEAAGGVSYIGSFANSALPNVSFVFPDQLANGTPKYTGEAAAHEAGHEFGLFHQAVWSGTTLVDDYNPGTSNNGPVMGDPYSDNRALWYDGVNDISSTTIQNDMAVIADAENGFGYRDDGISHSLVSPTPLAAGSDFSAAGIISTTSQVDYYQFTTAAGSISLSASQFSIPSASYDGMLSLKFSLYNSSDQLIASSGSGLTESITPTLAAGTYIVAISSDGSYGDVGQYTFSGDIVQPPPAAPTSLTAAPASTSAVNLSWTDATGDATGFYIERSIDDVNFTQISSTTSTSYQDTGLNPSTTYYYRIRAFNAAGDSSYAGPASATTQLLAPTAPTALSATSTNTAEIDLSWTNTADNAAGIYIERSPDNSTWTQIASVSPTATTYADTGLNIGATYFYRICAFNAGGNSAYSAAASAVAYPLAAPPMPAQGVAASATAPDQVILNWAPGPGAAGFLVQRSADRLTWNTIAQLPQSATSYTDTSADSASHYFYRVVAFNTAGDAPASNLASATTPGFSVILDNADSSDVTIAGPWSAATSVAGYFGSDFLQDNNLNKGQSTVTFNPALPEDGVYQVALRWTSAPNRANNVPVTVNYAGGSVSLKINERQSGGQWIVLGAFNFASGSAGSVVISNAGTDGIVVADAVQFVKISAPAPAPYRISPNVALAAAPITSEANDADALILETSGDTAM